MLLTQKQIGGKCQWSRHLPVKKIVHLEKRVDFYLTPLKKKKNISANLQPLQPRYTTNGTRNRKKLAILLVLNNLFRYL